MDDQIQVDGQVSVAMPAAVGQAVNPMVGQPDVSNVSDTSIVSPVTSPAGPPDVDVLSGGGEIQQELTMLVDRLQKAQIPPQLLEKAMLNINRIKLSLRHGGSIHHLDEITKYIEWVSTIPWATMTQDRLDIQAAKNVMDKNHFGLEQVKKRVLEYMSVLIVQKSHAQPGQPFHAPILFFVGLAGTGKTTFAKSIAETLGRAFVRIPFGGLSSPLDLRGESRTVPEAEPGMVIKALRRAKTRNPVILLDELDRVAEHARGAMMGVLLELLDPEQNAQFVDHFIDYPVDLSQVLFVATANNTQTISTAVLDRLEVVQMPSYTDEEKIQIAKNYILPQLLAESGLPTGVVEMSEEVWKQIARMSGFDPGIRSVERKIQSVVRSVAYRIVQGQGQKFTISQENMKEYIM